MKSISCATITYPLHRIRDSTVRCVSQVSLPVNVNNNNIHHSIPNPFVPQVVEAVDALYSEFRSVDNLVACNTTRVLKAFQNARVGSHHFGGCTGYGHDEAGGREALDQAFAEIVGAESAIVRSQKSQYYPVNSSSQLLAVAGAPYDTLEEVIGKRDSGGLGSLQDFGVKYREVPLGIFSRPHLVRLSHLSYVSLAFSHQLAEDGGLDWNALMVAVKPKTKCSLIQRSCGNHLDRSEMQNPGCLVMVDNCYGEFVESIEPPMVGADLIAGSLIKNPGGTIAPCGGYVAGRKKWVEAAAARLSAPGLGVDCGATPGDIMRAFFQGLFLSPQMVGEAIKGSLLIAEVLASQGYKVQPLPRVPRSDTVQAVQLGSRERLLAFCEAVQRSSPVGSYTKPIAGTTPGYASEVIFADGTFIDGSTSELSCDGPLREPFAVFCQGGTHWTQWGLVLGEVLKSI
ncbi:hypothetical protein Lal_00028914 [Lupinus albus]|nr:hypothetical protein Lal_00028914 [Lupinus albus]